MHQDTEKYFNTLLLKGRPGNGYECFLQVSVTEALEIAKLAYNLGYNHGYLAVDEKMIPSEFLQKRVDKPSET